MRNAAGWGGFGISALLFSVACSGSGAKPLPESAESGFELKTHAFSFENFAFGYDASQMTPELVARMFGEENACRSDMDGCVPTPAAQAWIETANAAMEVGRCEGLAVLSQQFFLGALDPEDFGAASAKAMELDENYALQRELAYWFSTQLVPGAVENTALMPREAVRFMADFMQPGSKEFYRIGMVQRTAGGFGDAHSLTPMGFEQGETPNIYYVHVYDNNFPDVERQIRLDVDANSWEYQGVTELGAVVFQGGEALDNPLYFAPTAAREGRLPCPFCEDTGTLTVTAQGAMPLLTDADGNEVGIKDGDVMEQGGGKVSPGFALCAGDRSTVQLTAKATSDMPLEVSVAQGQGKHQSLTVQGGRLGTVQISGELTSGQKSGQLQLSANSVSMQAAGASSKVTFSVGNTQVELNVNGSAGDVRISVDPDTGHLSVTTDDASSTTVTVSLTDNSKPYAEPKPTTSFSVMGADGASKLTVELPKGGYTGGSVPATLTANGMTSAVSGSRCGNGVKDEDESDVDCGGSVCGACLAGAACAEPGDCAQGTCASSNAASPNTCVDTCFDGRKDADEADVDCGGVCATDYRVRCATGQQCGSSADCALGSDTSSGYADDPSNYCSEGVCEAGPRIGGRVSYYQQRNGLELTLSSGDYTGTVRPYGSFAFTRPQVDGDYSVEITALPYGMACEFTAGATGTATDTAWVDDIRVLCKLARDTCRDGQQGQLETDVDCGGDACVALGYNCFDGKACAVDTDCADRSYCIDSVCTQSHWFIGSAYTTVPVTVELTPGGDRSGPSAAARQMLVTPDAGSLYFINTRVIGDYTMSVVPQTGVSCAFTGLPASPITAASDTVRDFSLRCTSCSNSTQEGLETDVDCGGADCVAEGHACGPNQACLVDSDCASDNCVDGQCEGALCENTQMDGDETDVDCGGSCVASGFTCELTEGCSVDADCASGICDSSSNTCVSCSDGQQNGDETAADCGGADCVASQLTCALGAGCAADSDCASGICDGSSNTCVSCSDGQQNGDETHTDCGGADCRAANNLCALGQGCAVSGDCAAGNFCDAGACAAAKSWSVVSTNTFSASKVEDAAVIAADDIWVSGDDYLAHYTGSWSEQQPMGVGAPITGMFALNDGATTSVWVLAEDNGLQMWNGSAWFSVLIDFTGNPLAQLNDIHGTETLMFVVGGEGQIAQRDEFTGDFSSGGGGFPLPPATAEDLYAVYVLDDTLAWAVGNNGAIVRYDSGVWMEETSPTASPLHDVWAVASDDVWAVGDGGTVVHYDGLSWSTVSSGVSSDLKSVWAADADHVWMVGAGGTVLFWEGNEIVAESSGTAADLGVVFGFDTTRWAMGENAVLIERN